MNVQRSISSLMGSVVLLASASFAQQVKTDYDRSTDFSQYRTYSWEEVHTEDALWVDRIKAAVNSALVAKGWSQVETGGNVCIMAMGMTQSRRTLNTYYDNFGGGWRWGGGFGNATTTESVYKVGTLVVDFFDSNTKKLIWRGSASDALSERSEKNIKKLDKGVAKMFDRFPPDTHKSAGL